MDKISHIISGIFSPLLVPSYAMALVLTCSILSIVSTGSKFGVTGVTFAITCIIPMTAILLLYKFKMISDPALNNRKERFVPYAVSLLSYVALAFYLGRIHAPLWLMAFPIGAAAAIVISFIVTLRWKISAHGAAMGGLVGMVYALVYYHLAISPSIMLILYLSILAAGVVGTARVILHRHTVAQVLAGTLNGFVCVFFAIYFLN